jgi:KDO2-lipid IV(A) lauroyltransferase
LSRYLFKKSTKRFSWLGKPGWWLEATLLKLFWFWVQRQGVDQAAEKGSWLFRKLGPHVRKHQHILNNLSIAFPELSQEALEKLAVEAWGNFGAVLAEYPFINTMVAGGKDARNEIVLSDASRSIVENKLPAVYIAPHLGSCEVPAATLARLGVKLATVYAPQSNPLVDRMVQHFREPVGMTLFPKENAIRTLVKEIRKGSSLGLLPDQRNDSGELIPFFGIDAPTVTSPAWLAIKMNVPLIPIQVERTGASRFLITFHDPIDTHAEIEDMQKRLYETTKQVNACFEQWIRKHPEQWHWTKRRWPRPGK